MKITRFPCKLPQIGWAWASLEQAWNDVTNAARRPIRCRYWAGRWTPIPAALAIQRGVTRLLAQFNIACLPEVALPNHRRADLMALTDKGEIWIIEIKSGLADFQADDKWPDYLPYCDRFYFAVAPDFPTDVLPENSGLIFVDSYGAEIMRDNKQEKLAAARRNLLLRRMARIGGFAGRD